MHLWKFLICCSWLWLEESSTLPSSEQGRPSSPGKGRNRIQTPVFCKEFRGAPLPQHPLEEFRGATEGLKERQWGLREGEGGKFFFFLLLPSPAALHLDLTWGAGLLLPGLHSALVLVSVSVVYTGWLALIWQWRMGLSSQ